MTYDIAIVGAGPAGATLARLLHGLSVVVIDKKLGADTRTSFRKPCGGLLAPAAQRSLARQGLNLPEYVLAQPQMRSVKTIDLDSQLVRHYPRNYINMDRNKFDQWLISLIPDTVTCLQGTCTDISPTRSGYTLTYRSGGETNQLYARRLVGADGANSVVRRYLTKRYKLPTIKTYISIQQWFRDSSADPAYMAAFDSSITDSYAWWLGKDGYDILGAALPVQNARQGFEELKQKLAMHGYSFDKLVKTESCKVLTPLHWQDMLAGKAEPEGDVFLIGEAGVFISPSSLEGISHAMNTACILADTLNSSINKPVAVYNRRLLPVKLKLMAKKLRRPFMYNKHLRKLVMASGLTAE
jgi:flavin-dependent dehydrogenase